MPNKAWYQQLEQLFNVNPCNEYYDVSIQVGAGEATVTLAVRPDMLHGGGTLHGSIYFKALDDAATFAASSLQEQEIFVTASFNIHFLRPISAGSFTSTARVLHQSRRLVLVEAEAVAENGRKLAHGSGTFMPASPRKSANDRP